MMSNPGETKTTCSVCGSPLAADTLGGLCPKCLLLAGMEGQVGQHLHVRCPQCHVAIEIVADDSLQEITCPSCDSRFSLVGDQTRTHVADRPASIGRLELLQRVGIGAFGSVWKARDPELDRIVAVKIPRKDQLAEEEAEQFLREARSAAQLKHPGIVSVHEVGRDGERIYIVSDFIHGVTLTDWLSAQRPTTTEAARLCRQIAQALQHAHENGVVHRDLKPSNIMLDDQGRPHVMDFGLAKREAAEVTMTVDGRVLGTPAYMSPEQARGEAHQADARSDVYSLGVILFEMLTGEKPFRGTSQMLLHQVLKQDPPSPRSLNASVPRDLETICLKCLEKEPDRRFASAEQLDAELQRFLGGQPIHSRPITRLERGWRWCRRNPLVAGLTAAVALSLLIGLATTAWQWQVARKNYAHAEDARGIAEQRARETAAALDESQSRLARVFVERGLQRIDVDPHAGLPWLLQAAKTAPPGSEAARMHRLRMGLVLYELPTLLGFWPEAADATFSRDAALLAVAVGNEALVYELSSMRKIGPLVHSEPVVGVSFTPQGDRLATVSRDDTAPPRCRIWNTRTGKAVTGPLSLEDNEYGMVDTPRIEFTEDGQRFVAVYAGLYNRWHSKMATRVFDSRTLAPVSPTFAHHSDLDYYDGYHKLSPDRLRVLVSRGLPADDSRAPWVNAHDWPDDMRPQQYDLLTGEPVHPPLDHVLDFYSWGQLVYSPDGTRIATSEKGLVKIWDAEAGSLLKEFPLSGDESYARVQFHANGESLFAIEPAIAFWWDIATGQLKRQWEHEDRSFVSPTGQYAVYADSGNGGTYVRDIVAEESEEFALPDVYRVRFCRDGSRLLLDPAGHDEAGVYVSPPTRVFRSADAEPVSPPWRFDGRGLDQPFTADGRYFLTKHDAGVWLWDLDAKRQFVEKFPADRSPAVVDLAVSVDRKTMAVLAADHSLTCWDTNTGEPRHAPLSLPAATANGSAIDWQWMQLSRSAGEVAVVGDYPHPIPEDKQRRVSLLQVWDLSTGASLLGPVAFDDEPATGIETVQFTLDDRQLAVAEFPFRRNGETQDDLRSPERARLHVFDVGRGELARPPEQFEHTFRLIDVTADGRRCLVMREDRRWETELDPVFARGAAQIFSAETWEPLTPLMVPGGQSHAWNVTLSPDGSRLVMGAGEIWNTATGRRVRSAAVSHRPVHDIVFQSDGNAFITVTDGGGYWDDPSELRFFSAEDGASLSTPMTNTRIGAPYCAVHPEGNVLAAAGHGLRFWDGASGTMLSAAIDLDVANHDMRVLNRDRSTYFSPDGRRLYIEAGNRLLVVPWGKIFESVAADEVLEAWSGILSGHRIDEVGGLIPLTAADYEEAWEVIQKSRSTAR